MNFSTIVVLVLSFLLIANQFDLYEAKDKDHVVGRQKGGSGEPRRHFKDYNTRKDAENAARNAGKGNKPIEHPAHQPGQKPHYHPADKNGNKRPDGSHFNFPKRRG